MILLLGGSGYIGSAFRRTMDRRGIPYFSPSRAECDYYRPDALLSVVRARNPSFVLNAAGFTGKPNVDACESQKVECIRGNVCLPTILREFCENEGLPWGHISSGCIFTGDCADGHGFTEVDAPNFTFLQGRCSFYAGCKAMAEDILRHAERCYVWRLRIPFNEVDSERNYLSKLMRYERLLEARNSLTHLGEFVEACLDCWLSRLEFGTYNLTNTGAIRTSEIVDMIVRSGVCDRDFRFFESEEQFMREAAIAPRSSCQLDNSKATTAGLHLSHVVDAIERSLVEWVPAAESDRAVSRRRSLVSMA